MYNQVVSVPKPNQVILLPKHNQLVLESKPNQNTSIQYMSLYAAVCQQAFFKVYQDNIVQYY